MKRIFATIVLCAVLFTVAMPVLAENSVKSGAEPEEDYFLESDTTPEIDVPSAILIEATTGEVLFEKNADEARAPASVTKTMTLLLVAEAIRDGRIGLDDKVSVSQYAASMGGSQVFLKEGEIFTVKDLIKCTVIASANDAAVALAEYTEGSESAFVARMNERASELGLTATKFENVTGLDDDTVEHTMSARDIATISRELITHKCITEYSSVWQDSIRDGEFTLTNTNRLVRYYEGCTGLKTGSTDKAGFCVSASAERNGTKLIAVVMGAESGTARNEAARTLLDFGFSSFALFEMPKRSVGEIRVKAGESDIVKIYADSFTALINKKDLGSVKTSVSIPESIKAPVAAGDAVGRIVYTVDGEVIGSAVIRASESIDKISFPRLFGRIMTTAFTGSVKSKQKN